MSEKQTPEPRVKVGDWVAFSREGRIHYGRVEYLTEAAWYPHEKLAVTTTGTVEIDDVLEVRRG